MRRLLPTLVLVAAAAAMLAPVTRAAVTATPVAMASFPAAFTVAPDGDIVYAERLTGEIHVVDAATHADRWFFTVPGLATDGEEGVLGIALDPDYPARPYVYVYAIRTVAGAPEAQVLRITDAGGLGGAMRVLRRFPGSQVHDGGPLVFGPDGKLYLAVGEHEDPAAAQDPAVPYGKVLRLTATGGVPATNPDPASPVWASGVRNSFGMAFDPVTGRLWETDNGPDCNDEVNAVRRGGNLGWGPSALCGSLAAPRDTNRDGAAPVLPRHWWTPTIAPTGLTFCASCGLGAATDGALLMGDWKTGVIHRLTMNRRRSAITGDSVLVDRASGVLSLERDPAGHVLFSDAAGIYRLGAG